MNRHALLCLALLAASLTGAGAAGAADTSVRADPASGALEYRGALTAEGLAALRAAFAAHNGAIRWLAVASSGGEVNAAMDIGEWVFEHGLNVRVLEHCLSACANYVFTAGRQKEIVPGAIVAWHGSAIQTEAETRRRVSEVIDRDVLPRTAPERHARVKRRLLDDTLAYVRAARERQREFFARIGVDERITTVGEGRSDVRDFWFLSVAGMAEFGITGVTAPADYPATNTRRFGDAAIVFIVP